ncbi:MAG: SPASM domain-containing protein, partial [Legionellales bacterium]|nr:SPASM domain-containing protein [Legionellales bacterium]
QMKIAGTQLLSIAGGEPIIRKDIFDVIEYAKSKEIDVSLTTNAFHITKEVAKKLDALELRTITVSLDGTKEHHDLIRGKGRYEKAITGIKNLKENCSSANISIKNTVNNINKHDYSYLIKEVEKLGVSAIKFNPIRLLGRAIENKHLLINQKDYINFIKNVQNISSSIKISLPKTPLDTEEYDFIPIGFGCTGGKETCNISPTGEFSACAFLGDDFIVGNIKNSSFLDLWSKSNKTADYKGNKICLSCPEYKHCRGGCRSRALFESGDLNAVDPLCVMQKNKNIGCASCIT